MSSLANSEDPNEIMHNVTFHQGLHCLLGKKTIFRERNKILFLENSLVSKGLKNTIFQQET